MPTDAFLAVHANPRNTIPQKGDRKGTIPREID